jgi:hypothetical protein
MSYLKRIIDGSSKLIEISFYDEVKNLTVPVSISWTLKNENNEIINEKDNISITPDNIIYLEISGEDNKRVDGLERYVYINSEYNSSKIDSILNLNKVIKYSIDKK